MPEGLQISFAKRDLFDDASSQGLGALFFTLKERGPGHDSYRLRHF